MKYLLCIPMGGFADNLKVIDKCLRYAKRNNRILVIDTLRGSLGVNFSEYFQGNDLNVSQIITDLSPDLIASLNKLDCYPSEVGGKISEIKVKGMWASGKFIFVDEETNVTLTFDDSLDYDETLIYNQWYGQDGGFDCLNNFAFTDILIENIEKDLISIPKQYDAMHIRSTDKRVNYMPFCEEIRSLVDGRDLLLCTDNYQVFFEIKEFFKNTNTVSMNLPPDTNGEPIHNHGTIYYHRLDQKKLNLDLFSDLIGLALSEHLYFPEGSIMDGPERKLLPSISGFSALANYLHTNSKLLKQLMRRS